MSGATGFLLKALNASLFKLRSGGKGITPGAVGLAKAAFRVKRKFIFSDRKIQNSRFPVFRVLCG